MTPTLTGRWAARSLKVRASATSSRSGNSVAVPKRASSSLQTAIASSLRSSPPSRCPLPRSALATALRSGNCRRCQCEISMVPHEPSCHGGVWRLAQRFRDDMSVEKDQSSGPEWIFRFSQMRASRSTSLP